MLFQRLILLSFFVLFVGAIGEKSFSEFKDDDDDDDDEKRSLVPKQSQSFSGNQPAMNNNNVPAQVPNQPIAPRRSPASPLATRDECKADVQRFCSKGADKPISNLKVLQCIDELDNVRRRAKEKHFLVKTK